jgi:nucleotide-binding universal stress UspA family protein
MGRIVVGVDGSKESVSALRWAFAEARLRRATVRVIHAWSLRYVAAPGFAAPTIEPAILQQEAESMLDRVVAEVGSEGIDVERVAVEGGPTRVLVDAAEDAELLVVGSRGHGGFAGLLLGSVSQQCAHHAPCPVVIVRA